jgi:para-nitrobenzyl esterase
MITMISPSFICFLGLDFKLRTICLFICIFVFNACAKNTKDLDDLENDNDFQDLQNESEDAGTNEDHQSNHDPSQPNDPKIQALQCQGTVTKNTEVKTSYGLVEGKIQGATISFLGIPFANQPIEDRRWQKAQPLDQCYPDDFKALMHPPACPQLDDTQVIGREDCLALNIWTPINAKPNTLPVMVFIHGGGNLQGSAGESVQNEVIYDGSLLAEKSQSVVVVIQYRLGILGWLNIDDQINGNFGLSDQIEALKWIKSEISAFGGNDDQITIFGESAGARNVCTLIASPQTKDLFQSAIMQSGACLLPSASQVQSESLSWLAQTPCASTTKNQVRDCLNQQSLVALLTAKPPQLNIAGKSSNFQPYVDGILLKEAPLTVIENGTFHIKSLIVGSNQQETSRSVPQITSEAEYRRLIEAQFGRISAQILNQYPVDVDHSPLDRYIEVTSDAKFVCNAMRIARKAHQSLNLYSYSFAQLLSNAPRLKSFGAYHGIELLFVFQQLQKWGYRPNNAELKTSEQMMQYWTNLADLENLELSNGLIEWPLFAQQGETLIFSKDGLKLEIDFKKSTCDFWDQLYVDF